MSKHAAGEGGYRAIKATALVLALVVAAPGIQALLDLADGQHGRPAAYGSIDAGDLVRGSDPLDSLGRIEKLASADGGEPPEAFAAEVGLLPGAEDVRADGSGTVVGFVVEGGANDVAASLVEHMDARGWNSVPLGGVGGFTFVKQGGSCTWVLATCTQVGDSTSVVMRCAYEG